MNSASHADALSERGTDGSEPSTSKARNRAAPSSYRRWLVIGKSSIALLTVAVVVAFVLLAVSSHPNGPAGLGWFALPILGIASVGLWLGVAVWALVHRRLPVGLVVAPLIGLVTVALVYSSAPTRARFAMDRPAFEAVIAQVPTPVVVLLDRDLTEDEANDSYQDFPGPCPSRIGTLRIGECATFSAGYLFYDEAGSGLIDDGGVAYLPKGAPGHEVGNGYFESPQFEHLTGPWYAFASSW